MRLLSKPCLRGLPSSALFRSTTARPTTRLVLRCYSSESSTPSESSSSQKSTLPLPSQGPQPTIDLKHIRSNAELYAQNCIRRNHAALAGNPQRIVELHEKLQQQKKEHVALKQAANRAKKQMAPKDDPTDEDKKIAANREAIIEAARKVKHELAAAKAVESALAAEMESLALVLPNLTSDETPDSEQIVLSYINCDGETAAGEESEAKESAGGLPTTEFGTPSSSIVFSSSPSKWRSHADIGTDLGILEFPAAAAASGWGWYYLLGDGARLEQALVQYALNVAHRHGWQTVSPPSIVRNGIAAACGFQPRDQGDEQQTYTIEGMPLSLTATAEIPLAALYADSTIEVAPENPIRRAAVSRCYRAEAGSRGTSTKGLYRVHEFTKVEMFAWTTPDLDDGTDTFNELVDVQTEILSSLGLPCRVLEMPATDLGAAAYRKIDIEAFFPGRVRQPKSKEDGVYNFQSGWGEVTSASICTDYQTRRLATRTPVKTGNSSIQTTFPWTLNGTALAVPRIIAAILENGWDEATRTVAIPECLWPWMDGQERLGRPEDLAKLEPKEAEEVKETQE